MASAASADCFLTDRRLRFTARTRPTLNAKAERAGASVLVVPCCDPGVAVFPERRRKNATAPIAARPKRITTARPDRRRPRGPAANPGSGCAGALVIGWVSAPGPSGGAAAGHIGAGGYRPGPGISITSGEVGRQERPQGP